MSAIRFSDLVDMQQRSVATFGPRPLFGTKAGGQWSWTSFAEFGARVDHFRGGLAAQGIGPGDTVAIIASNRVEWAVAAYATYGLGAQFCPMYENQLEKDWQFIIGDSSAKLLIVSTLPIYERVSNLRQSLKCVQDVFCMALPKDNPKSFLALEQLGKAKPIPAAKLDPDTVAGFIYTSGTTGTPKGVLLSHANLVSNINGCHEIFPLDPDDRTLSFLPWAHSLGQTVDLHVMMSMGVSVALAESVEKLIDNFAEVKPTVLVSVPRIFNRIYDGLQKRMDEAGGLKRKLFYAAIENEGARRKLALSHKSSFWLNTKAKLLDKLVFSKVRARFGGRLKYAISGGAALSTKVAEFIDRIGILVLEGYGLTETSPIVSGNCPTIRRMGSVGKPLPGVRVRIDKSALEDNSGDGEIVVFGPNVMKGYHNLPEETAAVMTADGGFRTGDRGRLDSDGFLYITGRIKEQYKLENGKYVVPAPLEEQLQLSPYIAQVYVDGANKAYNVALIVPDKVAVEKWAREQGISGVFSEILAREETREFFQREIAKYCNEFKSYERVREFAFIAEEFSTDNGMLTPSLKLKRRMVVGKYSPLLADLWARHKD